MYSFNRRKKINVNLKQKAVRYIKNYLRNSSLHGLPYIENHSLSYSERIFWTISFGTALAFAVYFIHAVYDHYYNTPIVIVINPTPMSMYNVPFPAVTVCSMNEAKLTEAKMILHNGSTTDKSLLETVCNLDTHSLPLFNTISKAAENITIFYDFTKRMSQPCKEMLKLCKWKNKIINCEYLFRTTMTDEGLCCSFNRLPMEYIYRNQKLTRLRDNYYHNVQLVDNWNPEKGYSKNIKPEKVIPYRSLGVGVNQGLTIVLDVDQYNYYCSSTVSVGFKLRFHTPIEIPRVETFSLMMLPEKEYYITFKPIIEDSTASLKTMDVEKRQCYFINEKYLRYYKIYNRVNCITECLANYTLALCGCIPNFLPTTSPSDIICGELQENCSTSIEALIDEQESHANRSRCNCLPECFHLNYETTLSFSNLWKKKLNNRTVVRIFTESPFCDRFTRKEMYEFSEFLSFTGGLLALFLGLSSLSIIEILYYLSLKLFCNVLRLTKK